MGPEELRLLLSAHAQKTVGEDVPAFGIGAELDLVHREEIGAGPLRHRLDSADPVLRTGRHDPLLAGDERHHGRAAKRLDPVIDLARQKPERQPDHTGPVAQHPFDREMRLAGIRRAQDREDP